MLNKTQAIAGIIGNSRARPRLSLPSAMTAICCTAMAGSHELKAEKTAPAMAVPESDAGLCDGFEVVRPFGRF